MREAVSLTKWPGDQERGFVQRGTVLGTYLLKTNGSHLFHRYTDVQTMPTRHLRNKKIARAGPVRNKDKTSRCILIDPAV